MRHALALILVPALAASMACGQAPRAGSADSVNAAGTSGAATGGPADSADARTLLQLEDQWATAVVRRDSATFERLLAPRFVYSEDDRTISREQLIRDIVSGTDTVQSAHNEGMQVHAFGPTAVVTGWLIMQGRGSAGAFNRRYRFTDTWARRDGRWQVVAAHDYLVPAARR